MRLWCSFIFCRAPLSGPTPELLNDPCHTGSGPVKVLIREKNSPGLGQFLLQRLDGGLQLLDFSLKAVLHLKPDRKTIGHRFCPPL